MAADLMRLCLNKEINVKWRHLFFRHDVNEIYALVGFRALNNDKPVPTFRDNLLVLSLSVKQSKRNARPLKMGPKCCPETLVHN
jgi:hypothetical protein